MDGMKKVIITATDADGVLLDQGELTLPVDSNYTKIGFRGLKTGQAEAPDEDSLSIGSSWER